jgi:CheY-like chemotaxis protein
MENLLKYNIVVADDDADDHFFLEEAMRASNIQGNLIPAYNGSELLDLLHTRGNFATGPSIKPDLVLLDLNMPVLDGFTALKQIKKSDDLKDIPVFIFTTSRRDADRKTCEQLGADEFF